MKPRRRRSTPHQHRNLNAVNRLLRRQVAAPKTAKGPVVDDDDDDMADVNDILKKYGIS